MGVIGLFLARRRMKKASKAHSESLDLLTSQLNQTQGEYNEALKELQTASKIVNARLKVNIAKKEARRALEDIDLPEDDYEDEEDIEDEEEQGEKIFENLIKQIILGGKNPLSLGAVSAQGSTSPLNTAASVVIPATGGGNMREQAHSLIDGLSDEEIEQYGAYAKKMGYL